MFLYTHMDVCMYIYMCKLNCASLLLLTALLPFVPLLLAHQAHSQLVNLLVRQPSTGYSNSYARTLYFIHAGKAWFSSS